MQSLNINKKENLAPIIRAVDVEVDVVEMVVGAIAVETTAVLMTSKAARAATINTTNIYKLVP
jgi:hypothetical protein